MKGFALALVLSLGLSLALKANAEELRASEVIGIATFDGEVILAKKMREKKEIIVGLKTGERIEIDNAVIYPDEIAQVLTRNLTTGRIVEKKPNQSDFN